MDKLGPSPLRLLLVMLMHAYTQADIAKKSDTSEATIFRFVHLDDRRAMLKDDGSIRHYTDEINVLELACAPRDWRGVEIPKVERMDEFIIDSMTDAMARPGLPACKIFTYQVLKAKSLLRRADEFNNDLGDLPEVIEDDLDGARDGFERLSLILKDVPVSELGYQRRVVQMAIETNLCAVDLLGAVSLKNVRLQGQALCRYRRLLFQILRDLRDRLQSRHFGAPKDSPLKPVDRSERILRLLLIYSIQGMSEMSVMVGRPSRVQRALKLASFVFHTKQEQKHLRLVLLHMAYAENRVHYTRMFDGMCLKQPGGAHEPSPEAPAS